MIVIYWLEKSNRNLYSENRRIIITEKLHRTKHIPIMHPELGYKSNEHLCTQHQQKWHDALNITLVKNRS